MNNAKTKHPKALYTLFATEMWERFSYYGMRAILTLYLTAELVTGGFGLPREEALALYAIFTGLVYLTPILGGWVADKFLGKRKTVYIGGLVMAIGQFMLAASAFGHWWGWDMELRRTIFNLGLGILIIGNGFFKPNISTIVGDFYDDNDPRKDSAFNIFYMGINLGAILGPFIAGALGENVFWGWGYFSAGIGMIIGVLWLYFHEETLEDKGLPPGENSKTRLDVKDWIQIFTYALGLVLGTVLIIFAWSALPETITSVIMRIGFLALALGLGFVIIKGIDGQQWTKKFIPYSVVVILSFLILGTSFLSQQAKLYVLVAIAIGVLFMLIVMLRSKNTDWSRMGVIITLAIFNITFWAGFEQAGGTMNLFAKDKTDRKLDPVWAPDFLKTIDIKYLGIAAGIFLLLWLVSLYINIYSDNEEKKRKVTPVGKLGLYGVGVFGFLAIWAYLSGGPEIPASWFQNVNPFAILIFAPLFSVIWLKLDALKLNPRTSIKFVLGLLLGALAFYVMSIADNKAEIVGKVSPMWLVVVYIILTLGELMLSPIGLSMITKLANARMVSVVMGLWMASFAAGNYVAGMLESFMHKIHELGWDIKLYPFISLMMLATALLLLVLSPLLNKAMKGIH